MNRDIEITAIGNELLKGFIVNTNAAEISKALFTQGFLPCHHTVLPDDPTLLKTGLKECIQRSRIVITTGGLGPTCDDITRNIAAELFHSGFHFDEPLAQQLKQRYGSISISLENQAMVPSKAIVLKNDVGTAPGFIFADPNSTLILMPGVPIEMRAMLHDQVIPYLVGNFPHLQKYLSRSRYFFNLSESSIDPALRALQKTYPEIQFGIYPSHGTLSIYGTIDTATAPQSSVRLDKALDALSEKFADHAFSSLSGKLEEAIHSLFIENKWTLSTAESCTGGAIASRLTKLPNASQYFLGSIVSYANSLKENLLGVPKETMRTYGAVSEQTALSMAAGAIKATGSDFSIAVTGIAGPSGGSPEKPVGTVWIAAAKKNAAPRALHFLAHGNRHMIIERSVHTSLGHLYRYCLESLSSSNS